MQIELIIFKLHMAKNRITSNGPCMLPPYVALAEFSDTHHEFRK